MGWASGSSLFEEIIAGLKEDWDEEDRRRIYRKLIPAFRRHDWDTLEECMDDDRAFADVVRELYPKWFDDETEED